MNFPEPNTAHLCSEEQIVVLQVNKKVDESLLTIYALEDSEVFSYMNAYTFIYECSDLTESSIWDRFFTKINCTGCTDCNIKYA